MTIRCFWLEPSGRSRVSLRRYAGLRDGEPVCPGFGCHNGELAIDEIDTTYVGEGDERRFASAPPAPPHDDPRWPTKCDACDYVFTDRAGDFWQVRTEVIYRRLDTGETMVLDDAPPGAMWDAWWYACGSRPKRNLSAPDGAIHLMVRCPDKRPGCRGDWDVDGPASNGEGWTRTGQVRSATPTVSANPSIGIGENFAGYHGWLRDGTLTEA